MYYPGSRVGRLNEPDDEEEEQVMTAFVIWALVGVFFVGMGIYDIIAKKEKPAGFWANAEQFPVADVRAYNKAVGKMWCVYGIVFILLGIPLLAGQNSPYVLLSIAGMLFASIGTMVVYVLMIEKKYRKK